MEGIYEPSERNITVLISQIIKNVEITAQGRKLETFLQVTNIYSTLRFDISTLAKIPFLDYLHHQYHTP